MKTPHQRLVSDLKKSGEQIHDELTPKQASLLHMAIGISGESGELLDAIKKHTIYQKPLDLENVIEELGDIEFFLEGIRQDLHLDRDVILKLNESKLTKRYPSKIYSNTAAQERADKCT